LVRKRELAYSGPTGIVQLLEGELLSGDSWVAWLRFQRTRPFVYEPSLPFRWGWPDCSQSGHKV